ncbi:MULTISPECIES: hypothetical protein [unclassified Gordonia (in: high G+C Gram-positive bacteria)]|uniref:hypothetical protein n=1 Tax=unclassified Gordonia (in: high G+C Gram-positive bacteria) TaxID=2657482 RepID=UPI0009AF14C0|nr:MULTISPECIES: hypothetical protein [unclassified Gordonia (in: high G+C Gram-positive bacteria)]MDF3280953.1 hypothetical protein [Gordonia sp. N1V]OPX16729.1 hypothetical protein B1964_03270 [Gordonia sp. i37]
MTAIAAAGVAIALGTTGCGAGQIAQTSNMMPGVNGGEATATWDKVEIRNLQVVYPADQADTVFDKGGPFEVSFTIANSSPTKTYKLTKIAVSQQGAPSSATVTITGEPTIAPGQAVRAGNPANVLPDGSEPSASGESQSSTASSTVESSSTEAGSTATTTSAARPTSALLGESAMMAELDGAGKSVAPGLTTELTFYFQVQDDNGNWVDAGTIKADASVDATTLQTRVDQPRGGQEAEGEGGH